ncbi:MFS transporter [Bacillus sp. 03113]|uniref:MFS transporter n=1 Tax=Bacillus sp. 03113 TaxID=2578211 RepID=UPI00215D2828|nr:MFS transporter [Bacillus sp. 03113]
MISLLRKEKIYSKIFLAGLVNGIGDRFSQVAVLALLLNLTESGIGVGIALAIRVLPFLLFGPISAWLVNRFTKKWILVAADFIRIFVSLSLLFVHSEEEIWVIYASTFLLAAGEAIYSPIRKSVIPEVVEQKNIVRINGLEQVMVGIILILGAFIGGYFSYLFGPKASFVINSVSFFIACMILSTLTFTERGKEQHQEAKKINIITLFFSSFLLQIILLLEILVPLFSGIDNVLISVYAVKEYLLGDIGVGLFYSALGIGLMLSYTVARFIQSRFLYIGLLVLMLEGAFIMVQSQSQSPLFAFCLFCFAAFCGGIGSTCFDSIIMKRVPIHQQGVLFSLLATISNTTIGLSMLATGFILDLVAPRMLGLFAGLGFFITGASLLSIAVIHKKALTVHTH